MAINLAWEDCDDTISQKILTAFYHTDNADNRAAIVYVRRGVRLSQKGAYLVEKFEALTTFIAQDDLYRRQNFTNSTLVYSGVNLWCLPDALHLERVYAAIDILFSIAEYLRNYADNMRIRIAKRFSWCFTLAGIVAILAAVIVITGAKIGYIKNNESLIQSIDQLNAIITAGKVVISSYADLTLTSTISSTMTNSYPDTTVHSTITSHVTTTATTTSVTTSTVTSTQVVGTPCPEYAKHIYEYMGGAIGLLTIILLFILIVMLIYLYKQKKRNDEEDEMNELVEEFSPNTRNSIDNAINGNRNSYRTKIITKSNFG